MILALVLSAGAAAAQGVAPAAAAVGVTGTFAQHPAPRLTFSADEMALAVAVAGEPGLAAYYGRNGLKPLFTAPAAAPLRAAVRAAVAAAPAHGLPPARYAPEGLADAPSGAAGEVAYARAFGRYVQDLTGGMIRPAAADPQIRREVHPMPVPQALSDFAAAADPAAWLEAVQPRDPRYLALQRALAARMALIAPPGTPPAPKGLWRPGARDPRLADLRARLATLGFAAAPAADPGVYDEPLIQAVAAYQQAAGLPADGVAGPRTIERLNAGADRQTRMILVALERMRWMGGHDLNARHIWVNIPEFTARIFDHGRQVFQTRVVVGKTEADQRTPEFSDEMEHVVVNPRWNVPRSITVKEYLPRLQQNPNAVAHLDIVDGRGRVIPREKIDFARYTEASFPYRMRQQPSDDNALGLVKFIFPNRWNIYLHDTPSKGLFRESVRAFSHGCVRVGDPFDLAVQLLSQQTDDPQGVFRRALNSGRETFLELRPHVPVHLVYFTAFPDAEGNIRFLGDVYGRDARVWQALARAGLETDE